MTKTVTDATDATRYLTFVADDNGTATAETVFTDAGITYNPDSNTLTVGNLSVLGTSTQVDTVTMTAANAIVFEGATADANKQLLRSLTRMLIAPSNSLTSAAALFLLLIALLLFRLLLPS